MCLEIFSQVLDCSRGEWSINVRLGFSEGPDFSKYPTLQVALNQRKREKNQFFLKKTLKRFLYKHFSKENPCSMFDASMKPVY